MKINKKKVLKALKENLQKIPRNHHQTRADYNRKIATTKALLEGK